MTSTVDFNSQLGKQLGFLDRSCAAYDSGFHDEAIRIATVIRVLVHQTRSSTSLLTHLNATSINLLSTTNEPSLQTILCTGMGGVKVEGGFLEYLPTLGRGPVNEFIPVSKWWNQVVTVTGGHRITRSDIVLAAANKDGGTHVDSSLTAEYHALARAGGVGSFTHNLNGVRTVELIMSAHLVSLRQMGHEVLHSPDLLALKL